MLDERRIKVRKASSVRCIGQPMVTLRPQQQTALDWLYGHTCGALFGDLGSGKTLVFLSLIQALKKDGYGKTLLIAPKKVKDRVWGPELQKFNFFNLITSTTFDARADIHLINPASMHKIQDWGIYDILVIDESTDFKNHGSKRFMTIVEYLPWFRRRYILTGGPIPNGYHDLWAQIYLLDFGIRLGKNITEFRNRYCQLAFSGFDYEVQAWAEPVIDRLIADIVIRIDSSDLQLPELYEVDEHVALSDAVIFEYRKLEQKLLLVVGEEKIPVMDANSAYQKCRQFTGGFVYTPEGKSYCVHREKLHRLGALHELWGYTPFLVVYQFTAEGLAIAERFEAPVISGRTSDKQCAEVLEAWNARELSMLVCQIDTVAKGLNLQFGGNHLIIYSVPTDFNSYFQVRGRLYRPGVKGNVYIHKLICPGTIDEIKLVPRLKQKESKQKLLLRALRQYRQRRI